MYPDEAGHAIVQISYIPLTKVAYNSNIYVDRKPFSIVR